MSQWWQSDATRLSLVIWDTVSPPWPRHLLSLKSQGPNPNPSPAQIVFPVRLAALHTRDAPDPLKSATISLQAAAAAASLFLLGFPTSAVGFFPAVAAALELGVSPRLLRTWTALGLICAIQPAFASSDVYVCLFFLVHFVFYNSVNLKFKIHVGKKCLVSVCVCGCMGVCVCFEKDFLALIRLKLELNQHCNPHDLCLILATAALFTFLIIWANHFSMSLQQEWPSANSTSLSGLMTQAADWASARQN